MSRRREPRPYAAPAADAPRFAGFWLRSWAFLVDAGLLALLVWVVRLAAGWVYEEALSRTVLDAKGETYAYFRALHELGRDAVGLLVPLLYFTLMEGVGTGATLGKRLSGIQVVRSDGRPAGLLRALARNLAKPLSFGLCCIGVLIAAWTARKRALHDWIGATWVVRKDRPRRVPVPPPLPR